MNKVAMSRDHPFQQRDPEEAAREVEAQVHLFGDGVVCDTDSRGYPTSTEMRKYPQAMRVRLLVVGLSVAMLLAAGVGTAAADPTNSPQIVSVVMTCEGVPITLAFLDQPPSLSAFTASTSVGIAVAFTITDSATGEIVFSVPEIPGFSKNKVPTQSCVYTIPELPGLIFTATAFFTPKGR